MKPVILLLASLTLGAALLAVPGCTSMWQTGDAAHIGTGTPLDRAIILLQIEARNKDADIRANCIEALQGLSDERSLDVIGQGLHDPDVIVRFSAAMVTGQRRVASFKPVLQQMAITDASQNVQVSAIYALARLGDTRLVGRLAETLVAPDPSLRANTAMVLGLLGDKSAIPLLQSRVKEADPRVKFELTAALARLGDPSGVTALVAFSVSKYEEDRIFSMAVWPDIKSPDAADVLLSGLQDPMPGMQERTREVQLMAARIQLTAARGLGKLGNPAGLNGALSLRHDGAPQIRALAALALGDILTPGQDAVLVRLMKDPDQRVRVAAAAAIIEMHTRPRPVTTRAS